MSFDGIFTHAMVDELKSLLKNGRLSKIHQPYQSEIILVMRANGKNHRVLLSAHPSYARIQVTQIPYENPNTPPNFCMLLRKQLEGAILEDIQQIGNDRIIHFTFKSRDEIGDIHNVVLIVELMGRHSNIFLIDQESKRIIDCIKHVPASLNSYRSVMPGATYLNPPHQDKLNPFTVTKQEISEKLDLDSELSVQRQLQTTYQGIGGDTAAEMIFRSESNPALLPDVFVSLINEVKDGNATPTLTENTQKDFFTPTPFLSLDGEQKTFPLLSELLDAYYGGKAEKDRVHQQGSELIRLVNNELQKNVKKLEKLHKTMAETELADDYRIKGEILTAYLHEFKRGATEIELPNFYEEDAPITIKLDIRKNPSQNAQKYFAKYQKLKNAISYVTEQIDLTMGEIDYLESVSTQLSLATPKDVAEIKEELTQVGYLKKKKTKKKQMKAQKSKPEKYHATDGTVILVGKNNLQNDELTLKLARKSNIWLHTKNIPGSHVIIQNSDPSEETILEAANIAAYYSKSQLSALVPVDFVPVKAIRKPNGAKPGFVIYEGQKTVYVTPDKELVESLRVN